MHCPCQINPKKKKKKRQLRPLWTVSISGFLTCQSLLTIYIHLINKLSCCFSHLLLPPLFVTYCMYICVCIYIYIYIYMCVCVCVYVCVYIYIYIYICNFSQVILYVCPLTKKRSVYNFNGRFIWTVRDRITTKKSRKTHFKKVIHWFAFEWVK